MCKKYDFWLLCMVILWYNTKKFERSLYMKKSLLAIVMFAILPVVSGVDAFGYEAGDYYSSQSARSSKTVKRGGTSVTNNIYYNNGGSARRTKSSYTPSSNRYDTLEYAEYDSVTVAPRSQVSDDYGYATTKKQTKKVTKSYSSQERKYFLAHPFFQPLEGRFGSVTDIAYAQNGFDFTMLNTRSRNIDPSSPGYNTVTYGDINVPGKEQTKQFLVKEDFSFGITDTLAILVMAQYDSTKISMKDMKDMNNAGLALPNQDYKDSGLNIFGAGLQYRFVDNDKWIGMLAGHFQHQKNTANTFIGEVKAGYKVARSTIYGLGRIGYSSLIDGDTYGAYTQDNNGGWTMLSYKTNTDHIVYAEAGAGIFAVLNKYFTLNGEAVFGHYDWHNQLNIKGAIGWQPADAFALNLYASTSIYDSANNKTKQFLNYEVHPDADPAIEPRTIYTTGDYKLKDYNEWKLGVQAILYF